MTHKLLNQLYGDGIINEEQKSRLEAEITQTAQTEEAVILKHKLVGEDQLFAAKSKLFKVPVAKPKPTEVPMEVLDLISEEAALNYKMVPISKKDNLIGVGMVYPESIAAQNALRFLGRKENFSYQVFLISFSDLENVLKERKTLKKETKKALGELELKEQEIMSPKKQDSAVPKVADEAPIIKMVLVIIRHAIEGNASDIHIEPARDRLNIRFRQDGILHQSLFLPLEVHLAIVSRIKILANLKIDETRVPQDGRFSTSINGRDIDFRVATFPTLYGEKVEIRVLDPTEGLKSFDKMGLIGRNFQLIQDAIKKPYGMVLASGPTGSGKSTTLYALLRLLNKEGVNIVTLEDPVEYSITGINQSQVKPEIGYTFSEGLRQILRQDPNIIMVGEIRDEQTADLAIHSALTGHVVLSTLHTNSAVGVVPRLIDMGIRPFLIPSTLRVAISQRLIRTLCDHCKKKVFLAGKARQYVLDILRNMPKEVRNSLDITSELHAYKANGCEQCNFKGYQGRIAIYEVLSVTDELAELITHNPSEGQILRLAQQQGMLTMAQEGIMKVLSGETTLEEIARVTDEK